jgi:hypothetical protein
LIAALEQRQPEHWLEVTHRLLNVSEADQQTIECSIGPSVAKVRNSKELNFSWGGQLANGPPQRREALAFVWYRCVDAETRNARLRAHAVQTMEMAGTADCLVIGFDVARPQEAYGVVGMVRKT